MSEENQIITEKADPQPVSGTTSMVVAGGTETKLSEDYERNKIDFDFIKTETDNLKKDIIEFKTETERMKREFKTETEDLKKKTNDYGEELKKINGLVIGVLIFFAISFVAAVWNSAIDKSLYFKFNDLYKDYSERTSSLREKSDEQMTKIDVLNNGFNENLLKETKEKEILGKKIDEQEKIIEKIKECFKSKKYWQYEQCFK